MYNNAQGVVVGNPGDTVADGAEWAALNGLRLTPQSLSPVPTANFTDLSEIYWTPYKSSVVSLINGGIWEPAATAELIYDVTGHTANLPVDLFAFWDGSAIDLEGLDWATATARATALVRQDGVKVKSGDTTRRYVGTIWPRAGEGTRVDWVTTQDLATATRPLRMDIWNVDNRVRIGFTMRDTGAVFSWTVNAWRQWRADANAQVEIIAGLEEEAVVLEAMATGLQNNSGYLATGLGLDSTVAPHADCLDVEPASATSASRRWGLGASLADQTPLGAHAYTWLQANFAVVAGTTTWLESLSGFDGTWMC